jgi:hypothetical protein
MTTHLKIMWNCIVIISNMTTNCVFCKATNVYYTCCLYSGCKLCVNCYKSLFVDTIPADARVNWHHCPKCKREIIEMMWFGSNGQLLYTQSNSQFFKTIESLSFSLANVKFSN